MSTRRTDAISAALVAISVCVVARRDGMTSEQLLRPGPFFGGAAVAVAVEAIFARWPEGAAHLWRRPIVRFGSPIVLIAAALSAGRRSSVAYAATLGGLAGYFSLLVGITAAVIPEPREWF